MIAVIGRPVANRMPYIRIRPNRLWYRDSGYAAKVAANTVISAVPPEMMSELSIGRYTVSALRTSAKLRNEKVQLMRADSAAPGWIDATRSQMNGRKNAIAMASNAIHTAIRVGPRPGAVRSAVGRVRRGRRAPARACGGGPGGGAPRCAMVSLIGRPP